MCELVIMTELIIITERKLEFFVASTLARLHLGVCRVASRSFQLVVACTVRYLSMDKNRRKRPLFATLVTDETRVFLNYTWEAREVSGHQSNLEERLVIME
jgi:hypothetical protein